MSGLIKDNAIVIFSENNDMSTADVVIWCKLAGYKVHRINSDDQNLNIYISNEQIDVSTSFDSFAIKKNTVCWFRRAEYPSIYLVTQDIPLKKKNGIFNFDAVAPV